MNIISSFFIKNLRFTSILTFFVIFAGYLSMKMLNSETFPNVNLGKVIILTVYRGATTEDVESKITKPIEEKIRSVSGIKRVRSVSQPSLSTITTEVDIDKYDVEEVIADLQRAVDRVNDLPSDLETQPSFIEIKTDEMPIIELSVSGGKNSFERNLISYRLSEELRDNKKISKIILQGYNEPQFNILLNAEKIDRYYVSAQEIVQAIKSTTVSIPAGFIETSNDKSIIKIDGKIKTKEDLEKISVRSSNSGQNIFLKDVAEISLSNKKTSKDAFLDGEKAVHLIVSKKSNEDIVKLSKSIKATLEKYEKKYPNYNFTVYSDEGVRVGKRLDVLYSNAVFGLILVIVFLLLFLSGRTGVMTALSLPLAVLATLAYMTYSGMSLNTITIMALIISIGMLVDNAVVISENFLRLRKEGVKAFDAAVKSITSLWAPVTATALTTIAAFLPMMVTKGVMGKFIIGIPIIVTVSLLFSLFESFFFLPARLVLTSKKSNSFDCEKEDWFEKFSSKIFRPFMRGVVRRRYLSFFILSSLIFSSFFVMVVFNKFILFPANQTEIYVGRVELKEGSPLSLTNQRLGEVSVKVKDLLGENVKSVVSISGSSMVDLSDPKGKQSESVGTLKVYMTEDGKNSNETADILKKLRTISVPGILRLSFGAIVNGPPVGDPLTVRLRSSNEKELSDISKKMIEKLEKVDGVVDLRLNEQKSDPELKLNVDTIKAQSLGVSLETIGFTFQTTFSGIPINDVNINNRKVDYFIELRPEDKRSIKDVMSTKVVNKFGKLIPLEVFATVEASSGEPFIERYDFKRAKTITSDIETSKITSIEVNSLAEKFFQELSSAYPSVSMVFGGEAENTAESMESLKSAMLLSVVGIFALLILVFNSFALPFIVLSTIPLGLVGVAYAFFIQGLPLSFLAMIGVIGLSGIIVNSGIVLISFIEERKKEELSKDKKFLEGILADSAVLRLRAVIITSLTTISGLIPTAYGIGGSDDFIRPMAMSISWGLVSGTILTLVWVPCVYMIMIDVQHKFKKIFNSKKVGGDEV